MSDKLDPSNIAIVKSKKIDAQRLIQGIDVRAKDAPADPVYDPDVKCTVCCMGMGAMVTGTMSIIIAGLQTTFCIIREGKRLKFDARSGLRHCLWTAYGATLVGSTLHFFLNEALWSGRKNTFGVAWVKAFGFNTAMWCSGIGAGTFFWRNAMRPIFGKRAQGWMARYPIPPERVEIRLLVNPNQWWRGMGWSYWLLAVFMGQFGYVGALGAAVYTNRIHLFMSPSGVYARKCAPKWRRQQIAKDAAIPWRN